MELFDGQFKSHQVVPDVIDQEPFQALHVKWPMLQADYGNVGKPNQFKDEPSINWDGADSSSFYTLLMVDPDAPSRQNPSNAQWNHWLVVNMPGSDKSKGSVKSTYMGPAPPKNSGLHRYVFLVYKQPGKLDSTHVHDYSHNRAKFNARNFAHKYNLQLMAGNFVQTENV